MPVLILVQPWIMAVAYQLNDRVSTRTVDGKVVTFRHTELLLHTADEVTAWLLPLLTTVLIQRIGTYLAAIDARRAATEARRTEPARAPRMVSCRHCRTNASSDGSGRWLTLWRTGGAFRGT